MIIGALNSTSGNLRVRSLEFLHGFFSSLLLSSFEVDTAQVALAGVLRIHEVTQLFVEEFANHAIVRHIACLVPQLQALDLAFRTLKLSEKLGMREATTIFRFHSRRRLSERALCLNQLSLRRGKLRLNSA